MLNVITNVYSPKKEQNDFQLGIQAYHPSKTNITYSVACLRGFLDSQYQIYQHWFISWQWVIRCYFRQVYCSKLPVYETVLQQLNARLFVCTHFFFIIFFGVIHSTYNTVKHIQTILTCLDKGWNISEVIQNKVLPTKHLTCSQQAASNNIVFILNFKTSKFSLQII